MKPDLIRLVVYNPICNLIYSYIQWIYTWHTSYYYKPTLNFIIHYSSSPPMPIILIYNFMNRPMSGWTRGEQSWVGFLSAFPCNMHVAGDHLNRQYHPECLLSYCHHTFYFRILFISREDLIISSQFGIDCGRLREDEGNNPTSDAG
jgi:hypothetical protein